MKDSPIQECGRQHIGHIFAGLNARWRRSGFSTRRAESIRSRRSRLRISPGFVTNATNISYSARRVENPDLRTVDVLIRRLRHKLSADLLVTQHGEGYFLAADVC